MKNLQGKYSLLICWLFMVFVTTITLIGGRWERHNIIKSDAAGYYAYLPAIFIYNNLFECEFYPYVDSVYDPGNGVVYYGVQMNHETGRIYFKYNYGVAAFEAPLFFVAHAYAKITGRYRADGYSIPYQLSVAITTVLFSFLSLLVLRKFLLEYFSDLVIAITIFIIGFGTNFLAQVITQPGISHIYLFFLFSIMLYSIQQLHKMWRWKYFLLLGIAIGGTLVIRPTDIFICFFPLLWHANHKMKLANALSANFKKIIGLLCIVLVIAFIQMLYWKTATNHWYYYTYRKEHFDFSNWQIINGLFSYRKGWFVYTPLVLLGFIGSYFVWRKESLRAYILPFTIYFSITLFLVFCWWQWYYGGSLGCRALVESIAVLAIPIAAFVEWLLSKSKVAIVGTGGIVLCFILLNLFQTAQYGKGIIHWQKMNKEYYWRVFGKWNVSEEDKKLLNSTEELTTGKDESR